MKRLLGENLISFDTNFTKSPTEEFQLTHNQHVSSQHWCFNCAVNNALNKKGCPNQKIKILFPTLKLKFRKKSSSEIIAKSHLHSSELRDALRSSLLTLSETVLS